MQASTRSPHIQESCFTYPFHQLNKCIHYNSWSTLVIIHYNTQPYFQHSCLAHSAHDLSMFVFNRTLLLAHALSFFFIRLFADISKQSMLHPQNSVTVYTIHCVIHKHLLDISVASIRICSVSFVVF